MNIIYAMYAKKQLKFLWSLEKNVSPPQILLPSLLFYSFSSFWHWLKFERLQVTLILQDSHKQAFRS